MARKTYMLNTDRKRAAKMIRDLESKLNFYRFALVIAIMALAVVLVGCL